MTAVLAIAAVLLLIGVDQLTKYLVLTHLGDGTIVTVLPDVLQFRFVANTGAAFSMFTGKTWLLSVVTAAILLVAIVLLARGKVPGRLNQAALLLIIAGGAANLIDRIFRHFVVDFIELIFVHFAVFNFADCCVTIGAVTLIISLLVDIIRESASEDSHE